MADTPHEETLGFRMHGGRHVGRHVVMHVGRHVVMHVVMHGGRHGEHSLDIFLRKAYKYEHI